MNDRIDDSARPTNPTEASEYFTVDVRPVSPPTVPRDTHSSVIAAIERYDIEVATWYRGAILVAGNSGHPDRLALAGHGLREVMNSVSRLAGLPQAEQGQGRLRDRFDPAAKRWRRAQEESDCFDGTGWSGVIDGPVARAMRALDELVTWDAEHRPARRETFLDATRELDGSGRRLPRTEENRLWKQWEGVRNYFIGVAHHSKATSEAEFFAHVAELDALLLRLVAGDVYQERKQLLDLIQEVEG